MEPSKEQKPYQAQTKQKSAKQRDKKPFQLTDGSKQEAMLERMIMSRMNALLKLWGGTIIRNENMIYVAKNSKHIEVVYATFKSSGDLYYDLVIRDTLTGHRLAHVEYEFAQGSEVIPDPDGHGVAFSNAKNQASLFADSVSEFVRIVSSADRAYNESLEKAKQLLPRST